MLPSCTLIPGEASTADWRRYVLSRPSDELPAIRAKCIAEWHKGSLFADLWREIAQMCVEESGHRLPSVLAELRRERELRQWAEQELAKAKALSRLDTNAMARIDECRASADRRGGE